MLIISRNIGESFIIGDLYVTVTGIFNKKVQLGIVNETGLSTLEGKLEAVITIPGNVKIKIIQIGGRQVRLGIKAPAGIQILRDNLAEKK